MIKETKQCDICGKIEGVELSNKDFVNDNLTKIKVKNWKGEDISLSFSMKVHAGKSDDAILKDSLDIYSNFNNFLEDDEFGNNEMAYMNFINQHELINKTIIKKLNSSNVHICKNCYNGIVTLMYKFGKPNRTIKI